MWRTATTHHKPGTGRRRACPGRWSSRSSSTAGSSSPCYDLLADVRLSKPGYEPPERRTIASGCGGGVSFAIERNRVNSDLVVTPGHVSSLMRQLNEQADLYRACGGVHTAALADAEGLKMIAEDIGRHNTIDKIAGQCLMTGISVKDGLLLTTGRLSSEILSKATRRESRALFFHSSQNRVKGGSMFRSFGWPEALIILVVILIVFGVGKLPQVGGALGKGLSEFRKGKSGLLGAGDEEQDSDDKGEDQPGPKTPTT